MAASVATNNHHHHHHQIFRSDSALSNSSFFSSHGAGDLLLPHSMSYLEKRQLFLRSYQFSRKQTFSERLRRSLLRLRRAVSLRLRSARRLRRVVWSRLRSALSLTRRRRRFYRLAGSKIGAGSRWPESW